MRIQSRRIALHINQHGHTRRRVPEHMAMEKPNARVIRPETEDSVAATWDLDCVTQSRPGCVIQTGIITSAGILGVICVISQRI
jgi:hypothetical protein